MTGVIVGLERLQLAHGSVGMAVIVIVIVIVASMGMLGGLARIVQGIAHGVASV